MIKVSKLINFLREGLIIKNMGNRKEIFTTKETVRNEGFTLVEIIVVVTVVAIIMVAIIGVVVSVFKVQNQTESSNKVVSGGTAILNELKKNILNSDKSSINCSEDKSSITFTNNFDGKVSTITCIDGKIASTSAQTIYLSSGDIELFDCSQFVTCYTLPSLEVSEVKFEFGVGTTTAGIGATQNFELGVTIRN